MSPSPHHPGQPPRNKRYVWRIVSITGLTAAAIFLSWKAASPVKAHPDETADTRRLSQRTGSPERPVSQLKDPIFAPPSAAMLQQRAGEVDLLPSPPADASWGPGLIAEFRTAMSDPAGRKKWRELGLTIPAHDIPAILDYLRSCPPILFKEGAESHPDIVYRLLDLTSDLLTRWAKLDLSAAAAWAATQPYTRYGSIIYDVLVEWQDDPAAAEAWVRGLPDSRTRLSGLEDLVGFTVSRNPSEAMRLGMSMDPGQTRDASMRCCGAEWARIDLPAAIETGHALQDPATREAFFTGMAVPWAKQDPAAAAAMALTELPEKTILEDIRKWAETDLEQAEKWVDAFPPGDVRNASNEIIAIQRKSDEEVLAQVRKLEEEMKKQPKPKSP